MNRRNFLGPKQSLNSVVKRMVEDQGGELGEPRPEAMFVRQIVANHVRYLSELAKSNYTPKEDVIIINMMADAGHNYIKSFR